ncbi:glycosyltransferase [Phytohabitans suffuscus]|uniref:glycosyltransferase n=1 Tax=Phytohabitans suffuscus TaxID=624315 RepID=UPI0015641B09|nr:glycosyltransferase [Phytohabitans suffuscus]
MGTVDGPLAEVVTDGVTGRLVPPDLLAGTIRDLLADEELRRAYGAEGARWVRGAYDWTVAALRTVEAYERTRAQHALTHEGATAAGLAA